MSFARTAIPSFASLVAGIYTVCLTACGGTTAPASSDAGTPAIGEPAREDAGVTASPVAEAGLGNDGATGPDALPSLSFDTCAAECRAKHGTGGAELVLFSCASSCSATCGAQNLFGKDEACTLCVVGKGTDTCDEERARCTSSPACATAFKCFVACL